MSKLTIDLVALARKVMRDYGLEPLFSADVATQVHALSHSPPPDALDLRHLLWSSIDNVDSQDLDQIEFAEELPQGKTRVLIGIADVSSRVPIGSPIDEHAFANTTAVYTGVETFMMLPDELCTDLTSLLPGKDHGAFVVEMVISEKGTVDSTKFYPALVRNQYKLNYEAVGVFLLQGTADESLADPVLQKQLRLQDKVAQQLRKVRYSHGALDLETIEASPKMQDGHVVGLRVTERNRARELIEDLMIAANSATAHYFQEHEVSFIRRIVRKPRYWGRIVEVAAERGTTLPSEPNCEALSTFLFHEQRRDPKRFPDLSLVMVKLIGPGEYAVQEAGKTGEGHFGLAIQDYTHSTAPNRRYPDLVTQRLLRSCIEKKPVPYELSELYTIAAACTQKSDAAQKVERFIRKAAAAVFIQPHIGEIFAGIVTGASSKGTYVRLLHQPVEGRVVRGEGGMRVGDEVRVKLISVDPERGHIDFAGLH